MIKKNIISFVVLLSMMIITSITVVNSAGLNVIMSNQNPDPVEPGNFVYVNVKISNSGDSAIQNSKITFVENANFKIAQGEKLTKEIGIIPQFSSSESSSGFIIAKYKILVDKRTPTGLNTISFKLESSIGTYTYDFDLLVQDDNPLIEIASLNIPNIEPGKGDNVRIEIKNINSIDLKSVKLALNLNEIENNIITMNSGSNEKIIDNLKAGETVEFVFDVAISPEAQSIPYLLPIKITYEDALGNSFEQTIFGTIKVFSPPYLAVNVDSQDIYTTGLGRITLAIANPGSSSIKGVQLQILESEDYNVIEGETQYVGDLNSDDFQTLITQIYINNPEKATLRAKLTYSDSYDVKKEEILELPLQIYDNDQLIKFGFANQGSSFGFSTIIVLIVGIVIGYIFFNIRNKRKNKKQQ